MANGITTSDRKHAKEILLERDHKPIFNLRQYYHSGILKGYFMPPTFLSKIPNVLVPSEFPQRRNDAKDHQAKGYYLTHVPNDYDGDGVLAGESTEREMFYGLKKHYEQTGDDCLVLHGHCFLWNDSIHEKDFIVLNLSKGYIMMVEAKATKTDGNMKKAMDQLEDGRKRIKSLVNSVRNISDQWKYIGVLYIKDGHRFDIKCCKDCKNFTIVGSNDIATKLQAIDKAIQSFKPSWNPEEHVVEFVELSTELMFETQGNPEAALTGAKIVEKISQELDTASEVNNIFFWTPEQLIILNAINEDYMVLFGYYGCGKTILLKKRAQYLLEQNPQNVIHFFVESDCPALFDLLCVSFQETRVHVHQALTVSMPWELKKTLEEKGIKQNHHLIVDEAMVRYEEEFFDWLGQAKQSVASLWVAMGGMNSKLNLDEFRKKIVALDMHCPTLQHCLRNCKNIISYGRSLAAPSSHHLIHTMEMLSITLKENTINDGILEVLPPKETWIEATQCGFDAIPQRTKCFLTMAIDIGKVFGYGSSYMDEVYNTFHWKSFLDFEKEEERQAWFALDEKEEDFLIMLRNVESHLLQYVGIEVSSMLCVCTFCPNCETTDILHSLVSRAKVSLVVAPYKEECSKCKRRAKTPESENVEPVKVIYY